MHTIFRREHNRVYEKLQEVNSQWDFNRLFEEARKIVSAEIQHITYNEYLPPILGNDTMTKYKLWPSNDYAYDDTIDPTVKNSFGAASFRFGHSQVPANQTMMMGNFHDKIETRIEETFHNPALLQHNHENSMPGFARWLATEPSPVTDRYNALTLVSLALL